LFFSAFKVIPYSFSLVRLLNYRSFAVSVCDTDENQEYLICQNLKSSWTCRLPLRKTRVTWKSNSQQQHAK